jgi:signal transduction histidine kinase
VTLPFIILIYFFYGLAFFSMGLLVMQEGGRSSDERLRRALRPLAAFGLVHAANEWLEMFEQVSLLAGGTSPAWLFGLGLALLAFSFLSLAAFGSYQLSKAPNDWRLMLLVPLGLEAVWVFGLLILKGHYPVPVLWNVAEVWTRYALAIPASLLAAVGLVVQQRVFRRSGLVRFGQDALWAAVAFGWYGLVGQIFVRQTPLFPSNFINQELFQHWFAIPIQLFRALMAIAVAVFVDRFLRAFQVETDRQIASLQEARLKESRQRETLRGELYQRVVTAQETERQRIARELHDETGQALTAIGMGLRGLSTRLESTPLWKDFSGKIRQLESLTTHSLDELQRLIADLRPSHLDDLGLPSALRWYTSDIQERTQMNVHMEVHGEEQTLSPAVKTALFRIVQEALTNTIKHAHAKNVTVNLSYDVKSVRLKVTDDGDGFDPKALDSSERISWGLTNMQERATLLGGKYRLRSSPGGGTLVEISIPYGEQVVEDKQ